MNNLTFTRAWRWSLLSMLVPAAFWIWFYIHNGFVPTSTIAGFWSNTFIIGTVSISRWFDILIGPIWISFLIITWAWRMTTPGNMNDIDWLFFWICVVTGFTSIAGFLGGIATGFVTAVGSAGIVCVLFLFFIIIRAIVRWANAN